MYSSDVCIIYMIKLRSYLFMSLELPVSELMLVVLVLAFRTVFLTHLPGAKSISNAVSGVYLRRTYDRV